MGAYLRQLAWCSAARAIILGILKTKNVAVSTRSPTRLGGVAAWLAQRRQCLELRLHYPGLGLVSADEQLDLAGSEMH